MSLHAAFLRGINLGNRRVTMDELGVHFTAFGLEDVETYRASGNVIFDHGGGDLAVLERGLEDHLEEALDYEVRTFVRPVEQLGRVVERDLVASAREDGFTPYVIFCRAEPDAAAGDALESLETPDDRFTIRGREVYYLRRGKVSESPVAPRHLESALGGAEWTRRKLTTVEGILAKFRPPGAPGAR